MTNAAVYLFGQPQALLLLSLPFAYSAICAPVAYLPFPSTAAPHRQIKDKWGFRMTARYEMYAELFARYIKHDFKPQIVRDPAL